jgi:transcriptional regulator with PAS, ATPase and Fis domain
MLQNNLSDLTSEDFFDILSSISDAVALSNEEGRVIWMNKSLCDFLNISQDEWLGMTTRELIKAGYITRSLANIKSKGIQTGIILTKNGREFMSIVRPIYDKDGSIKYYLSTSTILEELTELKDQLEKLRRQNERYQGEVQCLREILFLENELVFESSEMERLAGKIIKVAPFDTAVLITGESGVGKEVLAKTIHQKSKRKDGPFIPVVIPSIPPNLLETELFGYEDGAFTGAIRGGKTGLFEIAYGGTLFLDEIGDCPYDIQVKILRTLETSEIRKVGGIKNIKLDIRILAATNKDLPQRVRDGLFREDLFYRLNVFPIHIKPLRERPEDIEPLCEYFVGNINSKYNTKKKFSKKAMTKLKEYPWYGNIRELKNVVERLVILSEDDTITMEEINAILGNSTNGFRRQLTEVQDDNISPWEKYESYERSKILETLKQVKGNKTKAAQILGISRTKLYAKLRERP